MMELTELMVRWNETRMDVQPTGYPRPVKAGGLGLKSTRVGVSVRAFVYNWPGCRQLLRAAGLKREPKSMPLSPDVSQDRNRVLVDLLHACAKGQQPAFQKLYQLASPQLFAVLVRILKRRDLAEEALQDSFINIWRNASGYTAEKGTPMTWLVSICRYRALDMLRRERREVHLDPSDDEDENNMLNALADDSQTGDLLSHAEARALKHCLDGLNEGQRNSLKLAYFDGCSHEEIAGTLQAPLGTIKSWVRRGLQGLKRCLEAA